MRGEAQHHALVATAIVGLGLSIRLAAWPLVGISALPTPTDALSIAPVTRPASDSLNARTVARDAFRFTRRPALTVYDPLRLAEQLAPRPPKPLLQLAGIVWDSQSPAALIEGIPGLEGPRVLRVGETIIGLSVKQITPDRVVIIGMDTVWLLKVRQPWK